VRRLRPTLAYRAADGKLETKTVDELESSLLWFAGREDGPLAAVKRAASGLGLVQARRASNESQAIAALKALATSESTFRESDKSQDGNLDYGMLSELEKAKLIDPVLGSGTKQGYFFAAHPSTTTSEFLWFATASPEVPHATGDRYFFTNQAGVIFYSTTPFEVDPETCLPKSTRYDAEADKFVEAMVIPTGK
jgi:type IV pilus assembly protein PilA